jgi:3',5'-cyclic AMP phosphodiesterase CpdA
MKTAPAIDSAPFTALLFADPQSYTERSYSEIFAMLDNTGSVFPNGYDFIISVGDNVDNSANTDHYKYFLNTDPGFFLNSSFVYAAGNHESKTFEIDEDESIYYTSSDAVITEPYNSALLYYNISMPAQDTTDGAGVYYSFDYSGVHFTVLNTNDINGENKLGAAQMGWLVTDLQSTDKQYKVVIMHKSLYSLGAHSFDADVVAMRSQLTPIFADNGVNLVLAGHDHTYATTYYLDRDGKPVENDLLGTTEVGGDGVLYVTLGTVGNKYYDWVENENVPYYYGAELHDTTLSNPVFAKLYFDGEKLYYEPYQYNLETGEITLLLPVNELAIGWKVLIVIGGGAALGGIGLLLHSFKKRRLLALVAGK